MNKIEAAVLLTALKKLHEKGDMDGIGEVIDAGLRAIGEEVGSNNNSS